VQAGWNDKQCLELLHLKNVLFTSSEMPSFSLLCTTLRYAAQQQLFH
jgi:hypothetical protein